MNRIWSELTFWRGVAAIVVMAGLYATAVRFGWGLGASTNLSDQFPWGIWIGFDVMVGVGLAAGGFTITATVHLFNLERFRPIVRPAVLTAFLGYLLVIVGLLFDLGLPYRVWHPLIMWNPHSVMFEVAWCVMLYTTVLALEFSPMVLERFRLHAPLRIIHGITIPLVIAGVLLSTLHQSSLGTLYVILPDKLYGLWYSPLLPVFFFLSAIAAGLSMVTLESFMSSRAFNKRLELGILQDLARVVVVVLALYLAVKLQDMHARGAFALLAEPGPERFIFLVEMVFGALVPMILLAMPSIRADRTGLFCSALLVVLGFIVNRLNVATTGLQRGLGSEYFPSILEISVTAMLIALGFIAFRLAVKHLNVFPPGEGPGVPHADLKSSRPVRLATRGVVAALGAVLLAGAFSVDFSATGASVAPPAEAEPTHDHQIPAVLPGDVTLPAGEDSPGPVRFSHDSHLEPGRLECASCHAGAFPILKLEAVAVPRSGETMHEKTHCGSCHDGASAFEVEDNCEACHQTE